MQLEALEPLNLRKIRTVSELLSGYEKCSFGARMIGEVAFTLTDWTLRGKEKPIIIYDGKIHTPLAQLLWRMAGLGWFRAVLTPEKYASSGMSGGNVLVVGGFSERFEDALCEKPDRAIYINQFELARPGQIKDGYFPDAVFADPRFVVPFIYYALRERLEDKTYSIPEFIRELAKFGGLAQDISHYIHVFAKMVRDEECRRFFTISGAMTPAQMGLVICDMIELGMIHAITSTGALMAHGLVQGVGLKHFKYNPEVDDKFLAARKLNRITDTLEPESNFDHIEEVLDEVLWSIDISKPISTYEFHRLIGEYLLKHYPNERGILKSAYEKSVPIFVTAFADSEIGNDIYVHNCKRRNLGIAKILIDPWLDTELRVAMKRDAKRLGIITVGGGTPRNNDQNDAPLVEIKNLRLGLPEENIQYVYGCRVAPDAMHFGHLGGCTFSEGGSWRKFDLQRGLFAEVRADATIVWPLAVKFIMDS